MQAQYCMPATGGIHTAHVMTALTATGTVSDPDGLPVPQPCGFSPGSCL